MMMKNGVGKAQQAAALWTWSWLYLWGICCAVGASDNLLCDTDSWNEIKGSWTYEAEDCSLQNTDSGAGNIVWFGSADGLTPDSNYDDDTFELTATLEMASGGDAGLMFRTGESSTSNDEGPTYYVGLYPGSDTVIFGTMDDGWSARHSASVPGLAYNTLITLSIHGSGDVYTVYVDGVARLTDITRTEFSFGSIGLRTYHAPSTYYSLTYTAEEHCAQSIDGGNWLLVRHTFNKWFSSTDSLTGTADYGTVSGPLSDNEFAIPFDAEDDTEFLFSFGGCDKWLITTYDQFGYKWGGWYEATILKSHTSDTPYTARWYNRDSCCCEDPWISWADHSTASMIYGECNYGGHTIYSGESLNVWMRVEAAPTLEPTKGPTQSPSKSPSVEPTSAPTKDCSALHIDEFLVDCSTEFDGHGSRIQSLESGGSSMADTLNGHAQDIGTLKTAASTLQNATATMTVSIGAQGDRIGNLETETSSINSQLTQSAEDITGLQATVSGLANATATMTASINALDAKMQVVMEHLDILGDYRSESGMTAVGPMPLETSDYALYALAATNVFLVLCLAIYCVFVRTVPKYGKVAMYETEA